MEREEKKGKSGKIVALALALVLLIGGTYAWLTLSFNGTKTVRIKSGTLEMTLDDTGEGNGINIQTAVPMTENEGKTQDDKYEFTLTNTGNVPSQYTVYLDDGVLPANTFEIDNQYIGYFLEKEIYNASDVKQGQTTTSAAGATLASATQSGFVVLDQSTASISTDEGADANALPAGWYIKYTLRLWITDAADTANIQRTENQTTLAGAYAGLINVKATQIGIEADTAYDESAARPDTWVKPVTPEEPQNP